MAHKSPLVSIVILNWNGLADTLLCLEFVRKQTYNNYEIIIVDNGSTYDQKFCLKTLPGITFIDNPKNRGFTGGHIDGLAAAKGEFIFLLNNDAVPKTDYISCALRLFDDPDVAVVGGRSYYWSDKEPLLDENNRYYSYLEVDSNTGVTVMRTSDQGTAREVNTVSGSAVLVRKSAVDSVGYLYEPFFAYYEETDLFARMKRKGFSVIYSPDLKIWHKNGASSGASSGSSFFFYHIYRNRFMFAFRNFESPFLRYFLVDYYKNGFISVLNIYKGDVQARIGRAYGKAILDTLMSLPSLIKQRAALKKSSLPHFGYIRKVHKEQVVVHNFLLSASEADEEAKNRLVNNLLEHESTWIYLSTNKDGSPKHIEDSILNALKRRKAAVIIKEGSPAIAVKRSVLIDYLLSESGQLNIHAMGSFAKHAKSKNSIKIPLSWRLIDLVEAGPLGRLAHLQQWFFSREISTRLKLARLRNLVVAVFTFNLTKGGVEMQHIRNEWAATKPSVNRYGARERTAFRIMHKGGETTPDLIICIVVDQNWNATTTRKVIKQIEALSPATRHTRTYCFTTNTSHAKALRELGLTILRRDTTADELWSDGSLGLLATPGSLMLLLDSRNIQDLVNVESLLLLHKKLPWIRGLSMTQTPDIANLPLSARGCYQSSLPLLEGLFKPSEYWPLHLHDCLVLPSELDVNYNKSVDE